MALPPPPPAGARRRLRRGGAGGRPRRARGAGARPDAGGAASARHGPRLARGRRLRGHRDLPAIPARAGGGDPDGRRALLRRPRRHGARRRRHHRLGGHEVRPRPRGRTRVGRAPGRRGARPRAPARADRAAPDRGLHRVPARPLSPLHWAAGLSTLRFAPFIAVVVLAAPVRAFACSLLGATLLDGGGPAVRIVTGGTLLALVVPLLHPGFRRWLFARP